MLYFSYAARWCQELGIQQASTTAGVSVCTCQLAFSAFFYLSFPWMYFVYMTAVGCPAYWDSGRDRTIYMYVFPCCLILVYLFLFSSRSQDIEMLVAISPKFHGIACSQLLIRESSVNPLLLIISSLFRSQRANQGISRPSANKYITLLLERGSCIYMLVFIYHQLYKRGKEKKAATDRGGALLKDV